MIKRYRTQAEQRQVRVRRKLPQTLSRPRLTVFRSNQHIYAQIIDDLKGVTLVAASESDVTPPLPPKSGLVGAESKQKLADAAVKSIPTSPKTELAKQVGKILAAKALKQKITQVMFDRGKYLYHGRVEALAQGAREGGLKF